MNTSAADILREYGPFPGIDGIHGLTYDGEHIWFASGDRLNALDPASGKIGHAEVEVGDARFMLADEVESLAFMSPPARGGSTVHLHAYVEDVDAMVASAHQRFARELQHDAAEDRRTGLWSANRRLFRSNSHRATETRWKSTTSATDRTCSYGRTGTAPTRCSPRRSKSDERLREEQVDRVGPCHAR